MNWANLLPLYLQYFPADKIHAMKIDMQICSRKERDNTSSLGEV
jgi:hypothetical protein